MLLRSITQHVRTQNWVAVFLDLIIVVIGVFLGIQAANWNERQEDLAREQLLIARLQSDFVALEDQALEHVEHTRKRIATWKSLDALLLKSEMPEVSVVWDLLIAAGGLRPPNTRSPTYVQLINSGDLSILRSADLRDALYRHDDLVQEEQRSDSMVRQIIADKTENMAWVWAFDLSEDLPLDVTSRQSAVVSSPELLLEVRIMIDTQESALRDHEQTLKTIGEVRRALDANDSTDDG